MNLELEKIEINSLEKKLGVKKAAHQDATQNIPATNSIDLSEMEINIKSSIEDFYDKQTKRNEAGIKELENSFSTTKQQLRADGHDVQTANLIIESDLLMQNILSRLKEAGESRNEAKHSLNVFKRVNNLTRDPILRSNLAQNLSILLVVFMFFFETTLNAGFLNGKVAGGFQGAVAASVIVSFINVLCSFLLGSMSLPQLNHINKTRRNRALVVISIYVPVIIYFNLAMGVFRSVSDQAMSSFSESAAMLAAQSAAMPFDDLGSLTFTSTGLIATGLLFAIVSLIDGYKYDDEYPGFSAVGRKLERMKEEWQKVQRDMTKDFEKEVARGINQVESKKDMRIAANLTWIKSVDTLQRSMRIYNQWAISLKNSGNSLIRVYRSHNESLRSNPCPDYFKEELNFIFSEDPIEFFSSMKHEYITDDKKNELNEEHERIIMNEYKESSKNILEHYHNLRKKMEVTINSHS